VVPGSYLIAVTSLILGILYVYPELSTEGLPLAVKAKNSKEILSRQ
jgi:hypothetical protein